MNEILNPYIAGAPVVETSMFFGREDVFKWIETSLEGKYVGHILVLHGQRRVGKTSVLKQIPHFLPDRYIQVFFDLQGRTSTTLDRFLWWLASEIVRTLQKEHNIILPKPDRKNFADIDFLINDFLPSLRAVIGNSTLLLTFDEFDSLDRADIQETLAKPLIAYLRRLIELEEFRFIFSIGSSGHKLENMQASYTDFFKSALYRKISFLTSDDCHRLITKPVENVIKYDAKAIKRIVEITSGHPYFTQLACHELFALCQKTGARKITSDDVEAILDDLIERGTVNLKFVWDEASDLEKWALAGLAQVEGASNSKLGQFLSSNRVRFSDPDLNSAVIHLRDKDVLTQDNEFIIHLLKLWLIANRPMDRVREELVQVNPIANRYIEIGDEYRDQDKMQEAIESYQQALNVHPNDLRAQISIASIHLRMNSFQNAADAFDKCLKIDEDDVVARAGFCEAKLSLAADAQSNGQNEQAIEHIKQILVINPTHIEAQQVLVKIFLDKSNTLLKASKEIEALKELTLALDILPDEEQLSNHYEKIVRNIKERETKACLDKSNRALNRQRWDEAAAIISEALKKEPDNQVLQARLLEVKDAPRQFQLKAYKHEAELALSKGNWEKAISALETATQLAPENHSLLTWLETTKSDRAHAQIDLLSKQADKAFLEGKWEAAIKARQAALKLSPKDPTLIQDLEKTLIARKEAQGDQFRKDVEAAIAAGNWDLASQTVKDAMQFAPGDTYWIERDKEVQTGMHQAKLDELLKQAKQARANGEWAVAIAALESYSELNPQDAKVKTDIEKIQIEKRNSELSAFKLKAENAYKTENWKESIKAWEGYLALKPDDTKMVEGKLQTIRKKAQIASDFEEAQAAIHKKHYGQAIELLQGIIAQDPTYKTTSRLLVEAVEANKQRKPFLKKSWLVIGLAVIVLGALTIVFLPQIKTGLAALKVEKPLETPSEAIGLQNTTPEVSLTPDPNLEDASIVPALALEVKDYISTTPPTFEDDFSTAKSEWGDLGTLMIENSQLKITIITTFDFIKYPQNDLFDSSQFVISYDFKIISRAGETNSGFGLEFLSLQNEEYYELVFNLAGQWQISQVNNGYSKLAEGNFDTNQSQNVILSVYDDYLIVLLNDEVVALIEGIDNRGTSNTFFLSKASEADLTLTFDNIQFWDLEGVEFSSSQVQPTVTQTVPVTQYPTITPQPTEPSALSAALLSYINNEPATFEDNFSPGSTKWGKLDFSGPDFPLTDLIINEKLSISTNTDWAQFPNRTSTFLDAYNFALSFEFEVTNDQQHSPNFGCYFRSSNKNTLTDSDDSYYALRFSNSGNWYIDWLDPTNNQIKIQLKNGSLTKNQKQKVLLIVFEERAEVYINDLLIAEVEGISTKDDKNFFFLQDIYIPFRVEFDNIRFWNLDGVELEIDQVQSEVTNTPQPAWVTDFADPILATIAGRTPNVQDSFDMPLGPTIWYNTECSGSSGPENVDGQMIVSNCFLKWNKWYTDYVIEMDFRFLAGSNTWSFNFRNGQSFAFYITNLEWWDNSDQIDTSNYAYKSINHLRIIVEGQNAALFVNDQPCFFGDMGPVWKNGEASWDVTEPVAFDNLKIWNLNDLK